MAVGFVSEKGDPLKSGACQTSTTEQIFINGTWVSPRPNDQSKAAFDAMNGAGLALGKTGVTFFTGDAENNAIAAGEDYSCKGMSEWLAPAAQLESIGQDRVLSSFDTGLLMTNIPTGFDRLLLPKRGLPLAWGTFDGKDDEGHRTSRARLSLGERVEKTESGERTQITVNEMACPNGLSPPAENIPWSEAYRDATNIRLLKVHTDFTGDYLDPDYPIIYGPNNDSNITYAVKEDWCDYIWFPQKGTLRWPVSYSIDVAYVDPDTGELDAHTYTLDLTPYMDHEPLNAEQGGWEGVDYVNPIWYTLGVEDGVLSIQIDRLQYYREYYPDSYTRLVESLRVPIGTLPERIEGWHGPKEDELVGLTMEQKLYLPSTVITPDSSWDDLVMPPQVPCDPHLVFTESSTRTKFLMKAPSFGRVTENETMTEVLAHILNRNSRTSFHSAMGSYIHSPIEDYQGKMKGTKNLHVWVTYNSMQSYSASKGWTTRRSNSRVFVLRSDLNQDVFNFDAELIKSKLF